MPGNSTAFWRPDRELTIVQTRFYRHQAGPRVPAGRVDRLPPTSRPEPLFRQPSFGTLLQSPENARGNIGPEPASLQGGKSNATDYDARQRGGFDVPGGR